MSSAGSDASLYCVPTGDLGLKGPIERPAPGTLPLRGDLAHIALAGTHLAAHYVIPGSARVCTETATMHTTDREDSEAVMVLEKGAALEVLDVGETWVWGCIGPDGPSGYVRTAALEIGAPPQC
ncbi:MAG: hypothetical protein V2I27_00685 [Erythrobacter sp.]|jgi:hypothetical protein|nr:hypothetical protein [Erythrobacter sp.]